MVFAFIVVVLFLFAGIALDFLRFTSTRSALQASLDASIMAMIRMRAENGNITDDELEEYGVNFFLQNYQSDSGFFIDNDDENAGGQITYEILDNGNIQGAVTGFLDTTLLSVAGIGNMQIDIAANVLPHIDSFLEIALIADFSGSMNSNAGGMSRIERVHEALDNFIDTIFEEDNADDLIRFSIVPFNNYVTPVNTGDNANEYTPDDWNEWMDVEAQALYHGARYVYLDADGTVHTDVNVNHFDLYDSSTENGVIWEGCVEARPYPLDELDIPPDAAENDAFEEITDFLNGNSVDADYFEKLNGYSSDFDSPYTDEETKTYTEYAFSDALPDPVQDIDTLSDPVNFRWVPLFQDDGASNVDCSGEVCEAEYNNGYFTDKSILDDVRNSDIIEDKKFFEDADYYGYYHNAVEIFRKSMQDKDNAGNKALLDHIGGRNIGIDIENSDDQGLQDQEYIFRIAYPGRALDDPLDTGRYASFTGSGIRYTGKYELFTNSEKMAIGCPPAILPLTGVQADLIDYIDWNFTPENARGDTNISAGLIWGWRVLSPEAPFEEGSNPDNGDIDEVQKIVILLTDGQTNIASDYSSYYRGTDLTAYGYAAEERMGAGVDTAEASTFVQNRVTMTGQSIWKSVRTCTHMKNEGYTIYSIGIGVNDNLLEECASNRDGITTSFVLEGAEDLEDAFDEIFGNISALRIAG